MLLKEKAKKVIAAFATAALAVTAVVPAGFTMPTFAAEEASGTQTWVFTDHSVIPEGADGTNITSGNLTLKAGNYKFHDGTHGTTFQNGDIIEIKVSGPTKLTVGGCNYNNIEKLTVKSADGSYSETQTIKTASCDQPKNGFSENVAVYTYKGEATTLTLAFEGSGVAYIPIIIAEPIVSDEYKGDYKPDVWDFGAAEVPDAHNMLTVDIINGFYPADVKAGTEGVDIGSFATPDGQLVFNGNGKTNNRIRTYNEQITRKDKKKLDLNGVTYNGEVYSNTSSTKDIYLGIKLYAGDILTVVAGSNGGASTISFEDPNGEVIQTRETTDKGAELKFYATETGMYKLYTLNEKLVVFRLTREHPKPAAVSGKVDTTKAAGLSEKEYGISFTNQKSGAVTVAPVKNGEYSVSLFGGYTYDIALLDANGYVITSNKTLEVKDDGKAVTKDIEVKSVDLVNVTGKITGLSEAEIAKLELSFTNKDTIYVPEITVENDGSFTLKLESGATYAVTAEGVNDYSLKTTSVKKDADGSLDIEFAKKPVYDVTIKFSGLSAEAEKNAKIIFTNINEAGYNYTFKATDNIQLRDGQYSVFVEDTGIDAAVAKPIADVKVEGKAVSAEAVFEAIDEWNFSKYNVANGGAPGIDADKAHYLGLVLKGAGEDKTYLVVNADGEVKVPVKKGEAVTISYCYSGAFTINGKEYTVSDTVKGSTSKTDTITVEATADGYLTITVQEKTYFNVISKSSAAVPYSKTVTVGKDKNYKTINEALAAVAKMSRPNNERVEIVIDPGNYEEMLVINVPNVSLVNAAGDKASLELKDKGVNIGENVVRITSYYGHGYNYYSMGADCKWNADVLAANKSNGYLSTKNPGSGTTNGSYWNATVVVNADGFEADGIVFENSFNQYISEKEANDIVVKWDTGAPKGGDRPTKAGDTSVQDKKYVERAAALAINSDNSVFVNCKFIGRQDTLYGTKKVKAAFHKCDILGGTDFIFGGMTAVFYKCNLVMNTSEDKNDYSYLTAAQQDGGRGYLMYECTVKSTTPGVDTASEKTSKPGYFGRPWTANTSEVVFYNTTIETTDFNGKTESLINPAGWLDSLSGKSKGMMEFGTIEKSEVDNSDKRAAWATVLKEAKIDGKDITIELFLGDDWTKTLQDRGILTEEPAKPDEPVTPDTPDEPDTPSEPEEPKNDVLTDSTETTTGIKVEAEKDVIPAGTTLDAEPVANKTNDKDTFTFEISLKDKDGNKVQPTKAVTVSIPVPKALEGKTIYVYYVDDNGKYEDMKATTKDGVITFTTTHFSEYVVTTEKHEEKTPDTGAMPAIPAAMAVIAAAAGAVILMKKKR